MGGWRAAALPPQYLDALSALESGETSRPFETSMGVHIVRREAPPKPQRLSADVILIGFAGAYDEHFRLDREVSRTRRDAWLLAHRLTTELQRDPESFARLRETTTDHEDHVQHPVMTVHSRDTGLIPHAIAQLAVGGVSQPIATEFGIYLLRRTPLASETERTYGASFVRIPYSRHASSGPPSSRHAAGQTAARLAAQVANDPNKLADIQSARCCTFTEVWTTDRDAPALVERIARLAVGETARQPVEARGAYWIVRRIETTDAIDPRDAPFGVELVEPAHADLGSVASMVHGPVLAVQIGAFWLGVRHSLALADAQAARLDSAFSELALSLPTMQDTQRPGAVTAAMVEARRTLTAEQHARFIAEATALADDALMATF